MNAALVTGCALAGGLAGAALDVVAARIPPARHSDPAAPAPLPQDPAGSPAPHPESAHPESAQPDTLQPEPLQPEVLQPAPVAPGPPAEHPAAGEPAPTPAAGPPGPAEVAAAAVVTAVLFAAAAVRFGPVPELAAYCVLFAGLVGISVADLRVGLVPRVLLYPTLGLMVLALVGAAAVSGDWGALGRAAIGGSLAFAVFFVLWWFAPRGLGFGDVRLAGLMGTALGWLGLAHVYVGFLSGFVLGALMGTVKMLAQGTGRKTRFPFAPALAAGTVIGVLWGGWLANYWVLHT